MERQRPWNNWIKMVEIPMAMAASNDLHGPPPMARCKAQGGAGRSETRFGQPPVLRLRGRGCDLGVAEAGDLPLRPAVETLRFPGDKKCQGGWGKYGKMRNLWGEIWHIFEIKEMEFHFFTGENG